MIRILFYLVILAAGGLLGYVVAETFLSVAAAPGDVARDGTYALRHRPFAEDACDLGPYFLGLPLHELTVGVVTTFFGMLMQSIGRRVIRRG